MKKTSTSTFIGLCAVGFMARASNALDRTPVLALFAAALASPVLIRSRMMGRSNSAKTPHIWDIATHLCTDAESRE